MSFIGTSKPQGSISLKKYPDNPEEIDSSKLSHLIREANPLRKDLPSEVRKWRFKQLRRVFPTISKIALIKLMVHGLHMPTMYAYASLYLTVTKKDGTRIYYGLAGNKVVTTAGVGFIVDAFQNSVELENQKFHGIGTGTVAENVADTALGTELTTQYSTDNTRATGSLTEGASANIFRTVGTNTVDAAAAVTEHGILSSATVGAGVLLDRTVFTVINLANGNSLQSTYDLTVSAGG